MMQKFTKIETNGGWKLIINSDIYVMNPSKNKVHQYYISQTKPNYSFLSGLFKDTKNIYTGLLINNKKIIINLNNNTMEII